MRARLLTAMAALLLLVAACGGDPDPFGVGDTASDTGSDRSSTTAPDDPGTTADPDTTTTSTTVALPPSPLMEQIAASGALRVGVFNRRILPLMDSNSGTGFEPALAQELADRLFGNVTVKLVPVAAAERWSTLADETVDMVLRGVSHTTSRDEIAAFTMPYLLDGLVIVVPEASGYESVADLEGAEIGVQAGTTLQLEAEQRLAAAGVSVTLVGVAEAAAVPGTGDGYVDTWLFAAGDTTAASGLRMIWLGVLDPIAAVLPLGDPAYVAHVDAALREIIADGTWEALMAAWFPTPIPWSTAEMLAQPASDR